MGVWINAEWGEDGGRGGGQWGARGAVGADVGQRRAASPPAACRGATAVPAQVRRCGRPPGGGPVPTAAPSPRPGRSWGGPWTRRCGCTGGSTRRSTRTSTSSRHGRGGGSGWGAVVGGRGWGSRAAPHAAMGPRWATWGAGVSPSAQTPERVCGGALGGMGLGVPSCGSGLGGGPVLGVPPVPGQCRGSQPVGRCRGSRSGPTPGGSCVPASRGAWGTSSRGSPGGWTPPSSATPRSVAVRPSSSSKVSGGDGCGVMAMGVMAVG